jgi:hypothetical protein
MINRLFKYQVLVLIFLFALSFYLDNYKIWAVFVGYTLSLIFVLSSIIIIHNFWDSKETVFFKVFLYSLPIRFFVVLTTFAILLKTTKIDEIYFTVSFIISYLYHSITKMIFIHKILKKGSIQL